MTFRDMPTLRIGGVLHCGPGILTEPKNMASEALSGLLRRATSWLGIRGRGDVLRKPAPALWCPGRSFGRFPFGLVGQPRKMPGQPVVFFWLAVLLVSYTASIFSQGDKSGGPHVTGTQLSFGQGSAQAAKPRSFAESVAPSSTSLPGRLYVTLVFSTRRFLLFVAGSQSKPD